MSIFLLAKPIYIVSARKFSGYSAWWSSASSHMAERVPLRNWCLINVFGIWRRVTKRQTRHRMSLSSEMDT